jgi:hypothetical protein
MKKNDEIDVHLPQPPNKSSYLLTSFYCLFYCLLFIYRVSGRFVTRGVQKHRKKTFRATMFPKTNPSALITGHLLFSLRVFFLLLASPSVVLLGFVLSCFWACRKKGVQKRD